MIDVLESVCDGPIRLFPDKLSKLEPGMIIQLVTIDGIPCCTLSDGSRPFGIVGDVGGPFGLVSVWFDSMVLRTDKYEKRISYEPGDSLYVSKNGKLTTKKITDSSQLVGHVISSPDENKRLEVSWI